MSQPASTSRRRFLTAGGIVAAGVVGYAAGLFTAPYWAPAAKPIRPATVRLDWTWQGKHAPWMVAVEKGFYTDRGFSMTVTPGKGSVDTIRLVDAKTVPLGFADIGSLVASRSQGARVKEVAMVYYRTGAVIVAPTDIRSIKDLEGHSLASIPGDATTRLLPALFAANNVDPNKVDVKEIGPAMLVSNMLERQTDATIAYRASVGELMIDEGRKAGYDFHMLPYDEYGLDIYNNGLIAHEDTIRDDPDMVRAYVGGTMMGFKWSKDNPREAVDILLKYAPEIAGVEPIVRLQFDTIMTLFTGDPESLENGLGWMSPEKVKRTRDLLYQYMGDVMGPTPVAAEDLFTNEFIDPTITF